MHGGDGSHTHAAMYTCTAHTQTHTNRAIACPNARAIATDGYLGSLCQVCWRHPLSLGLARLGTWLPPVKLLL